MRQIPVDPHAVEVIRPDQCFVVNGTADQPTDGAVEAAGRVDEILPCGVEGTRVGRVGQYGKGGAQGSPAVRMELRAGFLQLVGNHPFSRPTVHKNDLLAWVPLQNEPDGVFVKALSTDDAHPIMGKIAAQFAGSVRCIKTPQGTPARTRETSTGLGCSESTKRVKTPV